MDATDTHSYILLEDYYTQIVSFVKQHHYFMYHTICTYHNMKGYYNVLKCISCSAGLVDGSRYFLWLYYLVALSTP